MMMGGACGALRALIWVLMWTLVTPNITFITTEHDVKDYTIRKRFQTATITQCMLECVNDVGNCDTPAIKNQDGGVMVCFFLKLKKADKGTKEDLENGKENSAKLDKSKNETQNGIKNLSKKMNNNKPDSLGQNNLTESSNGTNKLNQTAHLKSNTTVNGTSTANGTLALNGTITNDTAKGDDVVVIPYEEGITVFRSVQQDVLYEADAMKTRNPVDGGYTTWTDFSGCSRSCGVGTQYRRRYCENPTPQNSGRNCSVFGKSYQTRKCILKECPVNGGWTNWNEWGNCSQKCGNGTASRNRTCTNPIPAHRGENCSGNGTEERLCNDTPCPRSWTEVAAKICYSGYAPCKFHVTNGRSKVEAIRLRHISGDSECTLIDIKARWGCPYDKGKGKCAKDNCFTTLVIRQSPSTAYYPHPRTDKDENGLLKIPGSTINDDSLIFTFDQPMDGPLQFEVRHFGRGITVVGIHCIAVDALYS